MDFVLAEAFQRKVRQKGAPGNLRFKYSKNCMDFRVLGSKSIELKGKTVAKFPFGREDFAKSYLAEGRSPYGQTYLNDEA